MPVRTDSTTLPAQTVSVPTARRWVGSLLTEWGFSDAGWTAGCVVSELATNACLHARTAFTLAVRLEGDEVVLEISDSSLAVPQQRQYGGHATTGRGLHLVESLSRSWGVQRHVDGKTIWVRLSTVPAEPEVSDDVDALLDAFGDDAHPAPLSSRRPASPSAHCSQRAA